MYMPKSAVPVQASSGYMPKSARPMQKDAGSYDPSLSLDQYAGGLVGNILPSAGKMIGDMGSAAINTLNPDLGQNTLVNMGRLGLGTLQKADPTKSKIISKGIAQMTGLSNVSNIDKLYGKSTDYQPQAEAVGKFYKDRYGGVENIKKTLYEDPTGAALDAATVLSGVGGGLKGVGTLSKSSKLAEAGNIASKLGEIVDPIRITSKGVGAVNSKIKPQISKVLSKSSEAYATAGLGNPMKMKDIQGITGKTPGQLMREYNLFDRSPGSATEAIGKIDDITGLKIKTAPAAQTLDLLKAFDERIEALKKDAVISEAARGELEALARRKAEFVKYIGQQSSTPLNVPAETIRTIKKAVGGDIPDTKFSLDAAQTAKSNAAKRAYNIFKDKVNELAGTKQLGKDESGLIRLKKIFDNAEARGQSRQAISIKDIGFGGVGSLIAGAPGAIAGIAMNKFWNSPQAIKMLSNSLSGASNIFSKELPKVKYAKEAYEMLRLNRMANPRRSSQ